jgi:ADP-heptose:LPS heptosyltransferase
VAVRFYFSACFPDTPENRAFAEHTIRSLAESSNVVLLNTPFRVDDHADYGMGHSPRVHTIDDLMTPSRNLDVQTAVIAGAKAFVGTYGGYSYLAPLCGVPSLAFYSRREEFFAHHLQLADRVFRAMNTSALVPIDVRDAGLVGMALGPRFRVADFGEAGALRS